MQTKLVLSCIKKKRELHFLQMRKRYLTVRSRRRQGRESQTRHFFLVKVKTHFHFNSCMNAFSPFCIFPKPPPSSPPPSYFLRLPLLLCSFPLLPLHHSLSSARNVENMEEWNIRQESPRTVELDWKEGRKEGEDSNFMEISPWSAVTHPDSPENIHNSKTHLLNCHPS